MDGRAAEGGKVEAQQEDEEAEEKEKGWEGRDDRGNTRDEKKDVIQVFTSQL